MSADTTDLSARQARWREQLAVRRARADAVRPLTVEGSLRRVVGLTLEAEGCEAALGARCLVDTADGAKLETEVVGFADERLLLMPVGDMHGVLPNARVRPCARSGGLPVGMALLGRVIGADGVPLDGLGPLESDEHAGLKSKPINPMARKPIDAPLDVGVRAINALLTVGRGQRLGLFAGSGVGKSTLLNAVQPGLQLRAGELGERTGKGRHTTTVADLIPLTMGGYVADTPGLRGIEPFDLDPDLLDEYFPEMRPFRDLCRFQPCSHIHEPSCAVRGAVEAGAIARSRYDSYVKLYDEARQNIRPAWAH